MPTLLSLLLLLPLLTAVAAALLGSSRAEAVRRVSLLGTVATLVVAVIVTWAFAAPRLANGGAHDGAVEFRPQFEVRFDLLPLGRVGVIQFYLGLDGLNVWLILLTAVLMVPSVLVSWTAIQERVPEYYAWLLALETAMIGVFLAFDVILFYVFFELTLVPLFFLIGIWGGPERQYAARKFFVYTLAGSLITLLGVLGVVLNLPQTGREEGPGGQPLTYTYYTFSIPRLVQAVEEKGGVVLQARRDVQEKRAALEKAPAGGRDKARADLASAESGLQKAEEEQEAWRHLQVWLFAAMMVGFSIKVPLVPLHTWLPLAHVEAPTAGSVLLAGVLLKVGSYGFLRLCLPLTPDASLAFGAPLIGWLAVIGIVYGSLCALAQDDIKRLVAYSSVAHLGTCMLGMFALNEVGLGGSLLQMINHGLSTGALFLLVGMLYERYHTRKMADYSGMAAKLKVLAFFMVFITMSSVALPGLNGFVSEVLVLLGMYDFQGAQVSGKLLASIAAFGSLLGAWYMLTMVRAVFFGPLREPHHEGHGPVKDLNGREWITLLPIAALCLVLGMLPQPFLDTAKPELQTVARIADGARRRSEPPPAPPVEHAQVAPAPDNVPALGE
jgi:NADH-quinone oxidoreductase subunit M